MIHERHRVVLEDGHMREYNELRCCGGEFIRSYDATTRQPDAPDLEVHRDFCTLELDRRRLADALARARR